MHNYKLYYDSEFDFDAPTVRREHATPHGAHIQKDIDGLVKSFESRIAAGQPPMINPVFVTVYEGFMSLHPGKCRVKALKLLGITRCPALIYAPQGYAYSHGRIISPSDAAKLFTGESVAEWSDRWFAVKRERRGADGKPLPAVVIYR